MLRRVRKRKGVNVSRERILVGVAIGLLFGGVAAVNEGSASFVAGWFSIGFGGGIVLGVINDAV